MAENYFYFSPDDKETPSKSGSDDDSAEITRAVDELILGICGEKGNGSEYQFLDQMRKKLWHIVIHISDPFQSRENMSI